MTSQKGGFMETNTLVSKVAFLILVLIGFIFLFRYASALIAWAFTPSGTPHLIDGMLPGVIQLRLMSILSSEHGLLEMLSQF